MNREGERERKGEKLLWMKREMVRKRDKESKINNNKKLNSIRCVVKNNK